MFAYIDENGAWVFDITTNEVIERLSNGLNVWESLDNGVTYIQIFGYGE